MTIRFKATQERVERLITVDEYIGMSEGNMKMMMMGMSKFMLNEDGAGFMDPKEARKILGALTLAELRDEFTQFNASQEDAVVPPELAAS